MTITEETALAYQPLTSETRVKDFHIPKHLTLGGRLIELPISLTRKDAHFLLDEGGKPIRAAWISKPLAHILNSFRFENPEIRYNELRRALIATDNTISSLIKYGVLKDKHGPGAMAFCQANENVPEDSILISSRTFDTLCLKNPRWKYAKTVMAVRFPNLGPGTTQELKLIVDKAKGLDLLDDKLPTYSLGNRISNLKELLSLIEEEKYEDPIDNSGLVDAFYINPNTLKNGFEGDGDGDQIFIVLEGRGLPKFEATDLTRVPGKISQDDIDLMISKASRTQRTDLKSWLGPYFDDVPIGPATYAIRWILFNELRRHKDTKHPMAEAWKVVAPEAIQMIEFVMDIRKGNWTDKQIELKMRNIQNKMKEIKKAKEDGNWFAKTVTSRNVEDVSMFVRRFKSLQEYVDLITYQPSLPKIYT